MIWAHGTHSSTQLECVAYAYTGEDTLWEVGNNILVHACQLDWSDTLLRVYLWNNNSFCTGPGSIEMLQFKRTTEWNPNFRSLCMFCEYSMRLGHTESQFEKANQSTRDRIGSGLA